MTLCQLVCMFTNTHIVNFLQRYIKVHVLKIEVLQTLEATHLEIQYITFNQIIIIIFISFVVDHFCSYPYLFCICDLVEGANTFDFSNLKYKKQYVHSYSNYWIGLASLSKTSINNIVFFPSNALMCLYITIQNM